jgi:Leucine-rich repeat (LRR) protein
MDIDGRPVLDRVYDVESELQDIGLEDQYNFEAPKAAVNREVDVVHDQLPSVEEHKASQQVGGSTQQLRKISIAVALGIIVATVFISIGVVIGRDSNGSGSSTNNNDESATPSVDEKRLGEIMTLITNMGWADETVQWDTSSPQRKAAAWLTSGDPKKMEVDATEEFMNRYILATIYYALDGDNWAYDLDWFTSSDVCEWTRNFETKEGTPIEIGVTCNDGGHIKELYLPKMNMKGTIPHEMGLLLDLKDLNLFGNELRGSIPDSMKNLRALEVLILHDNDLDGTLPHWITSLTNLKILNLAENKFRGELPEKMGATLKSLETLVLENNIFSGTLDPLLNAKGLTALYLGGNDFDGPLDTDLFVSWVKIEIMDISDNRLSGKLPSHLFIKDDLLVVDLHGNQFSGTLPRLTEEGASLEFLALHNNNLTGPIGAQFVGLDKLAHLDLSQNLFNGDMPTLIGEMKSLKYLYLAFNEGLNSGPIPKQYATLPNLVDLSLQKTNRRGSIPYQFEALSKLVLFDMNDNKLSGAIPYQLGEMSSLSFLLLKDNNLNGTIPATFQGLSRLTTLLLDHNKIMPEFESICEPALPKIITFTADCSEQGQCSCCTTCCLAPDKSCNDIVWFSSVDPIAENGYVRDSYIFPESDIIFPAPTNVIPNYYKNFSGYYSHPP